MIIEISCVHLMKHLLDPNIFYFGFQCKLMWCYSFRVHVLKWYSVTWHCWTGSCFNNRTNYAQYQYSSKDIGTTIFALRITSNGSRALEHLPPIKRPILTSFPWIILWVILSRYFQSSILLGVAISSSPTGKFYLVYNTGRSIHTFFRVELVTFKSLIALVSWLFSPFIFLILMVVMVPSLLKFLTNSLFVKVPWLQQSNMAYFFSPFLDLLQFILIGTYT